jgi:hypothetical protein
VKTSLAITLSAAALILIAALATLGVLTAVAGQKSGLEQSHAAHCGKLTPTAGRGVAEPDYGARLTALARCNPSHDR